jgi:DNA-binding Xre family transcriptional regulator
MENLEAVLAQIILQVNFQKLNEVCNKLNISLDELLEILWEKGYFRDVT